MGSIEILNALAKNLEGLDFSLSLSPLTVVTGPVGSGKTALIVKTVFAEAKRRLKSLQDLSLGWLASSDTTVLSLPVCSLLGGLSEGCHTVGSYLGLDYELARLFLQDRKVCSRCGVSKWILKEKELISKILDVITAHASTVSVGMAFPCGFISIEALRAKGFEGFINMKSGLFGDEGGIEVIIDTLSSDVSELTSLIVEDIRLAAEYQCEALTLRDNGSAELINAFCLGNKCWKCGAVISEYFPELFSLRLSSNQVNNESAIMPLLLSADKYGKDTVKDAWNLSSTVCGKECTFAQMVIKPLNEVLAVLGKTPAQLVLPSLYSNISLAHPVSALSTGERFFVDLLKHLLREPEGILYICDDPTRGMCLEDTLSAVEILDALSLRNHLLIISRDAEIIKRSRVLLSMEQGALKAIKPTDSDLHCESKISLKGDDREFSVDRKDLFKEGPLLVFSNVRTNWIDIGEVCVPVGKLTVITGGVGSGKSILVGRFLHRAVTNGDSSVKFHIYEDGGFKALSPSNKKVRYFSSVVTADLEMKFRGSPYSNVATYSGIFDEIRELFSRTRLSRMRGYGKGDFSLTKSGGLRCPVCKGRGYASTLDVEYTKSDTCNECGGDRYKREAMDIYYNGKNIVEVMKMTVSDAVEFFKNVHKIRKILDVLLDIGLAYLPLGRKISALSYGELKKLALSNTWTVERKGSFYLYDRPCSGLGRADSLIISQRLKGLVAGGNTVVIADNVKEVLEIADCEIRLSRQVGSHTVTPYYRRINL